MKLVIRSLKNVFRNPVRLLLVVILLGTCLMFVAAMVSLDASSQRQLAAVRQQIGTTISIQYEPPKDQKNNAAPPVSTGTGTSVVVDTPHIPNSIVEKIKKVAGVASIQATLSHPYLEKQLQSLAPTLPPIAISGYPRNASDFTVYGGAAPKLVAGRAFQDSDANTNVAMMSKALAEKNHLKVGDTFTLNGKTFTLIGLYTTPGQVTDNTFIIPLDTLQRLFQLDGVDSLTVKAASEDQVESVANALRKLLGSQFTVDPLVNHYSNVLNALHVAQQSIRAALIASFLIAAAIIIFAVLMLIRERTAEIAVLKTIGASHLQVLRQFWTEILVMNLIAAALAIGLLIFLGPPLTQLFDVDAASLLKPVNGGPSIDHPFVTNIISSDGSNESTGTTSDTARNLIEAARLSVATLNPQTLLIIVGVGIGLALVTSLIPTWFVARLKPAHVLRKAN
uniref:ABC transporter permease n=1 Tax=Thermosporothrix sp. COM3 TaxID=2490863 RepID=A0A455SG87_9CHLR|nr:hypothetical protein KTC_22240 [Thermosporothrix sp. COM3]